MLQFRVGIWVWMVMWFVLVAHAQAGTVARLPDFTQLVKDVAPAVVNISTTRKRDIRKEKNPHKDLLPRDLPEGFPFDELLKKFFRDQEQDQDNNDDYDFEKESLGSGFIVSQDGYLLTNHHVVKDADEIVVRLSDRREFKAKLIGIDKRSDIALLKIDASNLPVVKIGSSAKLEVGEWVIAIGSPFGFDHSVTVGVVSAKGRSLPNDNYVPFIQTDVAINPGNSGGPLFNMDGEVVGVNSQIFSRTGGYMGLSFAIPIDVAMDVTEQLKKRGKVTRGWLGVYIQDVTRELAESFGMSKPVGALVTRVLPDSPAEDAGIQVGDVIIEYDGKEVPSSANLPPLVGMTKLDKSAKVKLIRNGKQMVLGVKIGELPEEIDGEMQEQDEGGVFNKRLGISLSKPDRKLLKKEGLEHGLLVENVERDSPAQDAGMMKGDLIVMLAGKKVKEIDQLGDLVDALAAGKSVPVYIHRRGSPLFLPLKIPND